MPPSTVPTIAWFHRGSPQDLRRLGLPALLAEQYNWRSHFLASPLPEPCDIAILPANATDLLPQLAAGGTQVLLDLDDQTVRDRPELLDNLRFLASQLAKIVTRGPLAARWAAENLEHHVDYVSIADPAAREAELRAVAMRFGLANPRVPASSLPKVRLWFAEPGDLVSEEEVFFVLNAARRPGLALVAPRSVLDWLEQAGLPAPVPRETWQAGCLNATMQAGTHFELPLLENTMRRHALLARHGVQAAPLSDEVVAPFLPATIGQAWNDLLRNQLPRPAAKTGHRQPMLLLFMDLIQDLELALPIIAAVQESGKFRLQVAVTSALTDSHPRVLQALGAQGIAPEIYDRQVIARGLGLSLQNVDALLTIVETTLNVHRRAHLLTLRAQSLGIPTFTLQHGLENVGLSYFDNQHDSSVDIHSDHILTWFPPEDVPAMVPEKVRPRLIHVGRPRMAPRTPAAPLPFPPGKRAIAVFENLHWDRYSPAFRDHFLQDCFALAQSLDDVFLILRPHPAGQWAAKVRGSRTGWPTNLILAAPGTPEWGTIPSPALIAAADMVITTPSSIAVDAAVQSRPVAVAGYELDVSAYAPLPILRGFPDWLAFASNLQDPVHMARIRARFLGRVDVSGPSEARIVQAIETTLAGRLRRPAPVV